MIPFQARLKYSFHNNHHNSLVDCLDYNEAVVLEEVVVGDGVNSSWIAADH